MTRAQWELACWAVGLAAIMAVPAPPPQGDSNGPGDDAVTRSEFALIRAEPNDQVQLPNVFVEDVDRPRFVSLIHDRTFIEATGWRPDEDPLRDSGYR